MKSSKLLFVQVARKFPDDETAEEWLIKQRWHDGVECPHRKSKKVSEKQKRIKLALCCSTCRRDFSTMTGSLMHDSKIGFCEWAIANFLVATSITGMASTKLAHDLGVMKKTAWYMMRIREAYSNVTSVFKGEVEIDETYVGGKEANNHEHKKQNRERGPAGKTAVACIKERETGLIVAKTVRNTSKETLQGFIQDVVEEGSLVYTDAHKSYAGLKGSRYEHATVEHSTNRYVDGQARTNGTESFWSFKKRGISSVHHWVSVKHLPAYVDEFATRYNLRKGGKMNFMFHKTKQMFDRQLSYKQMKVLGGGQASA